MTLLIRCVHLKNNFSETSACFGFANPVPRAVQYYLLFRSDCSPRVRGGWETPMANVKFKLDCPKCETEIVIRSSAQIGHKTECPKCKYRFTVPDVDDEDDEDDDEDVEE